MSSSSTEKTRVTIVGAGLMGRWHADAARRVGASVVAIVDRERSRAETLSATLPGCRPYEDLGEVIEGCDVVHVCTPTATHASIAQQAIEAARHVLVEKPVAPTAERVAALLAVADEHKVLLCPVHQFPFQNGVRRAVAHLPDIAPVQHIAYTTCSAGAAAGSDHDAEQVAIEILAHPLSLLARLVPGIDLSLEWSVRHPAPGEIRALAQAGDVTVSLLVSMRGRPTINRVEIVGADGTAHLDLFHGFVVFERGTVSRRTKVTRPFTAAAATTTAATANLARRLWRRELAYPGLRELVAHFYAAVNGREPSPISPAETLAIARGCDRLRELIDRAGS